jgi:hypothetical protein
MQKFETATCIIALVSLIVIFYASLSNLIVEVFRSSTIDNPELVLINAICVAVSGGVLLLNTDTDE